MTRDEIKYAKLGHELRDLSLDLSKETSFLKHVKKMAKLAEEEYIQELSPSFRRNRRGSISKSPDNSPKVRGSTKLFNGNGTAPQSTLNHTSPSRKSSMSPTVSKGRGGFNIEPVDSFQVGNKVTRIPIQSKRTDLIEFN
eukprot:CAMPEP_0185597564 /NCGR_PEP_ID=MMETSP0434-20130131/81441_1 /TAXON_ID=626734 ORGANISM="Favella taraikaensis, Strain Fe Narragansett Bay" /NCGR_SAMPLE_ID=MMETSP0434 /ASSEMBLY_ACC=CAM_ASM_000379 /LENGTH=139 /DNA_ID=CAMNT_0028226313 /DNA_START=1153 /DNA_END=1572 /DNA_ORIENTATION=-